MPRAKKAKPDPEVEARYLEIVNKGALHLSYLTRRVAELEVEVEKLKGNAGK